MLHRKYAPEAAQMDAVVHPATFCKLAWEDVGGVVSEPGKAKDVWDKVAAVTPLVLGLAVTGVGALFTQLYNFQQLQLNRITALEKLRPLLTSQAPEDREFGYASFAALGYEDIAVRIVGLKKDESGRSVLLALKKSAVPQIQTSAREALDALDAAVNLVNIAEFGDADHEMTNDELPAYGEIASWTRKIAEEIGVTSKLGLAIIYDTRVSNGVAVTLKCRDAASAKVPPPLGSLDKEAEWLNEFLERREERISKSPIFAKFPSLRLRIERLRQLLSARDWDLRSAVARDN